MRTTIGTFLALLTLAAFPATGQTSRDPVGDPGEGTVILEIVRMGDVEDRHLQELFAAVAGDPVRLVGAVAVGRALRTVALRAGESGKLHVGGVREIGVVGLARVDLPRDLAARRHERVDERLLIEALPERSGVAFGALGEHRDAVEPAVGVKGVAVVTGESDLIAGVVINATDTARRALARSPCRP